VATVLRSLPLATTRLIHLSQASATVCYLAMAWREPIAPEEERTTADIIKEMCRPRTWDDIWQQHVDEQIDLGADPEDFNLQF
jgi:hypothetical protein